METKRLNKNDITTADLSSFYMDVPNGKQFLVYAPLEGKCFLADRSTVEKMESTLVLPSAESNLGIATEYKSRIIHHPSEFTTLSILPNLKCNFKCSYCYSAKGRSTAEIPIDKLKTMLDWFINTKRVAHKALNIFVSGGGEPLLSSDKLRFIFEYGSSLAEQQGLKVVFILNTNGSLVTLETIELFKAYHVEVGVSFDILPDIQNTQRGQYEIVAENIRTMVGQGVAPSISSVITEKNVDRMMEMVEVIVNNYPGIRHLNFDPAMDNDAFVEASQLDSFYQRFEENFLRAKSYCGQRQITLDCDVVRHAEKLFPRYCQGQLCLVASGDITMCHTVSSPEEKGYDDMVYGKVEDGKVVFDEAKFAVLVNRENFMHEECESCIAKWHCSGGCMMYRRNYGSEKMKAVCRFTQRLTTRILLLRMEYYYRQKNIGVNHLHKLTILPTHRCNFKCSYCFSAKGRQDKTISEKQAFAVIDYFIDRQRTNFDNLWLAILGGGEPFLAPELTASLIQRASRRAKEQGFNLGIGLTTNGSLYHAELSRVAVENHVNLGVSFEVLKDIQNEQRQHYDDVVPVVRHYLEDGVDVTIKSIITPKNVERLEEMVMELHRLFPQVKRYKLQIVEDPVTFSDRAVMRRFYSSFTEHFFVAQEKGRQFGIDVYVLASKFVDMDMDHFCGGEMCLNPEGTLTVCHRFSSPAEEQYHDFVYGSVDQEGRISLDEKKLAKLMSHDITQTRCHTCIVKNHCGGGCLAQSSIYESDQLDIICDWTRSFMQEIHVRRGY